MMTEQILELLKKATYDVLGVEQVDQQLFAELIVKECAKRVDYWESRQGEHCDDLLKHFGVGK
jgi:hypothetical protein